MEQERALDPDPVRCDPANGEVLVDPTTTAADADTLEILDTLAVALDHPDTNPDCVANVKFRNCLFKLAALNFIN